MTSVLGASVMSSPIEETHYSQGNTSYSAAIELWSVMYKQQLMVLYLAQGAGVACPLCEHVTC